MGWAARLLPRTLINAPMSIMLGFADSEILRRKRSFSKLMEFSPERIGPMPSPPLLIRMDCEIDALVFSVVNAHELLHGKVIVPKPLQGQLLALGSTVSDTARLL